MLERLPATSSFLSGDHDDVDADDRDSFVVQNSETYYFYCYLYSLVFAAVGKSMSFTHNFSLPGQGNIAGVLMSEELKKA